MRSNQALTGDETVLMRGKIEAQRDSEEAGLDHFSTMTAPSCKVGKIH